jgi:ABC-type transport system involved in multi-copper enzyme maturation permease subunit
MSHLRAFITAEWFKLQQSRTARATLIAMAVTPITAVFGIWAAGGSTVILPRALQLVGASMLLLTGLSAFLLTATVIGSEYEQGMMRVTIGRGVSRPMFVLGKGAALLLMILINTLAGWFFGSIAAIISHVAQLGTTGLTFGILTLLTSGLDAVPIVLLSAAATIGLGLLLSVVTRSTSFAMLDGLGLFMVDFYLQAIANKGTSLSILGNTAVLLDSLTFPMFSPQFGVVEGGVVTVATAVLTLITYALIGTALAIFILQRQDLES